ncbi:DUF6731 family protein [Acidovorax sp. JHL-3]|uniref:DUF6731 family protein n=1 Tax=Acidovorax sp. JHL-3 TaxID=1276755 RepID=UPI0012DBE387|nr:DUF6731 family protein [Acidovorax sp. JHL-3]
MKRIKVFYYQFFAPPGAPAIEELLKDLEQQDLGLREKICGVQTIRLDEISERHHADGTVNWHLKFSKFRDDNWPGVAAAGQPAKDLELEDGEILSEETVAIYSTKNDRLVIQYNHFGVRASKIREYLNQCIADPAMQYSLTPILTNEALEKYQNKQIVTSIDACIEGISEADIAVMEGTGLEGALKKSIESKATKFEFRFSVDARVKRNKVDRGWIAALVDGIRNRAGDNDTLKVAAKANEDDTAEVIDLLEARKFTEFNADQVDRTIGRRYDSNQLFGLLEQCLKQWV